MIPSAASLPPVKPISRALGASACAALLWASVGPGAVTLFGSGSGEGAAGAPAALSKDEQVLVAAVKEISLAADEAQALRMGTNVDSAKGGVRVEGFEMAAAERLKAAVAPFVGVPVTKEMLSRLRDAIELASTGESGRVFVARYPRQSISQGRIALAVTVQRDANTDLLRAADASGAPSGVVPILRSGAAIRGTKFFVGVDNQLSRALGDERIYAGAQVGNVFDPRSTLGILLMSTPDSDTYRGGSLNHGFRFSEQWRLDVGASASEVETSSATTTTRRTLVKVEPVLTRRFALGRQSWHEVRLGLEWRADHAEVSNGVTSQTFELPGLLIQPGWAASLADRWGRTRLDVGLNLNTAWLGETPDYTAYGARDSSYATLRIEASRITKLGSWGPLSVRGKAQLANQDIPAIDHFYGSGMAGVRGYDENSYHGADAWFASVEHQGPRISLPKKCSLQPVVFVDAAGFPGGASDDNIAGAGVGIRLRAGEGFTLRVDAARAIGDRSAADEPGVVHFSVSQRW